MIGLLSVNIMTSTENILKMKNQTSFKKVYKKSENAYRFPKGHKIRLNRKKS